MESSVGKFSFNDAVTVGNIGTKQQGTFPKSKKDLSSVLVAGSFSSHAADGVALDSFNHFDRIIPKCQAKREEDLFDYITIMKNQKPLKMKLGR